MAAPTSTNNVTVRKLSSTISSLWDKIKNTFATKDSPALTGTPTAPTAAAGTNTTQIATTAFVKTATTNLLAEADAMLYKGTISGSTASASYGGLTVAADKGHTYKVTAAGKVNGIAVEVGDMLICNTDGTAAATSSNYSTIAANWDYVQTNLDGVVVGPASSTSGNIPLFDGTTGKLIKNSSYSPSSFASSGHNHDSVYFKSSGSVTLVSGSATKIGTSNGADVKLTLPTIPSGTQLVYDCGTGSTSGTDFDNALAAFNAGKWVIIRNDGTVYYCVGTYNSGLRFKKLANDANDIKVDTLSWTRGSAPTAGTQLTAALSGHTHTIANVSGLTDALAGKQDTLPTTWNSSTSPSFGVSLVEGGIDQSLKNISQDSSAIGTDTMFLRHDAIGQSSSWKASNVSVLWNWIKGKIADVLSLTTRENDTPYFGGLASQAISANSALTAGACTGNSATATASRFAETLWAGSANGAHVFATIDTTDPDHPVSEGKIEIGSSGSAYTKITPNAITSASQGGGYSLGGTTLSLNGTGYGSVTLQYSGGLELSNSANQFAIKVDNINENITVAKSNNTTTISGPQITTPKLTFDLAGSTNRVSLQVNSSANDALRICSASEPLTLFGLVASSFTGNLTGNVTGRCSGSVDYVQNTDSGTIANNAPFSSCKTYFEGSSMTDDTIKMVYNVPGDEKTLIFSKNGTYGSILRWGYTDPYLYIARKQAGTWMSSDFEKISAGSADTATKATEDRNGNVIDTTYLPRNNINIVPANNQLNSSLTLTQSYQNFDTWGSQSSSTYQAYVIQIAVEITSLISEPMQIQVQCLQNDALLGIVHDINLPAYGSVTIPFSLNCIGNSFKEQIKYTYCNATPKVKIFHSYTRMSVGK